MTTPVVLTRIGRSPLAEHELSMAPSAPAGDISAALVLVPASAVLVDFYGDVDLTLLFREVPAAH